MATIFDLPEELMVEILRRLAFDDVVRAKQVCRTWKRIGDDIVCIFHTEDESFSEIPPHIAPERVTHLSVHSCNIGDGILVEFVRRAPNLRIVCLHNCIELTGACVLPLMQLHKCTVLTMVGCGAMTYADIQEAVAVTKKQRIKVGFKKTLRGDSLRMNLHPPVLIRTQVGGSWMYGEVVKFFPREGEDDSPVRVIVECVKTGQRFDINFSAKDFVPTFELDISYYECERALNRDPDCCEFQLFSFLGAGTVEQRLSGAPAELEALRARTRMHRAPNDYIRVTIARISGDPAWYLRSSTITSYLD